MSITKEKTLVVLKPDAVQRVLVGEIIKRFEQVGLKLIALKMVHVDKDTVKTHYTVDPNWVSNTGAKVLENLEKAGKPSNMTAEEAGQNVLDRLQNYMCAGPVVACVLEGAHAVKLVRKLVGSTEPLSSDVGTIRGDFVLDSYELADADDRSVRNVVHASGSVEEAEKEINIWFSKGEMVEYQTSHEKILYDVNFDNVSE